MDCIEWELQNLSLALQLPPSPTTTEPLGEVIHQYMAILSTTQRQTNLTNSLLLLKRLKNAHRLVTHIYKKGPQTLIDAISEVEKLNTAQQLMAMIIQPSTVNVMSNEEDCCFQCQEPGHIT